MFFVFGCATAPPPPPLDAVLAAARQQHKPVVLEVFTTWCRPCKYFAKRTLPHKDVQKALGEVIFASYDAERGPGESVAARYKVGSYPSFLVLDSSGMLCKKGSWESSSVKGFIELIHKGSEVTRSREAVMTELEAHRTDPQQLLLAARWHIAHHFFPEAFALYEEATNLPQGGAEAAAQARWESHKLRRFLDQRERLMADAHEQLSRYPGTPSAGKALLIAALSGDLPALQVQQLVGAHLRALKDPPPLPAPKQAESEASQRATYALEDAIAVALAAHVYQDGLVAAQRLVSARPSWIRAHLLLARAYNDNSDRQAALAQLTQAERLAKRRPLRRAIQAMRLRMQKDGTLPYRVVDSAPRRLDYYLQELEGDSYLDGVDSFIPYLAPTDTLPKNTAAS